MYTFISHVQIYLLTVLCHLFMLNTNVHLFTEASTTSQEGNAYLLLRRKHKNKEKTCSLTSSSLKKRMWMQTTPYYCVILRSSMYKIFFLFLLVNRHVSEQKVISKFAIFLSSVCLFFFQAKSRKKWLEIIIEGKRREMKGARKPSILLLQISYLDITK